MHIINSWTIVIRTLCSLSLPSCLLASVQDMKNIYRPYSSSRSHVFLTLFEVIKYLALNAAPMPIPILPTPCKNGYERMNIKPSLFDQATEKFCRRGNEKKRLLVHLLP